MFISINLTIDGLILGSDGDECGVGEGEGEGDLCESL